LFKEFSKYLFEFIFLESDSSSQGPVKGLKSFAGAVLLSGHSTPTAALSQVLSHIRLKIEILHPAF